MHFVDYSLDLKFPLKKKAHELAKFMTVSLGHLGRLFKDRKTKNKQTKRQRKGQTKTDKKTDRKTD